MINFGDKDKKKENKPRPEAEPGIPSMPEESFQDFTVDNTAENHDAANYGDLNIGDLRIDVPVQSSQPIPEKKESVASFSSSPTPSTQQNPPAAAEEEEELEIDLNIGDLNIESGLSAAPSVSAASSAPAPRENATGAVEDLSFTIEDNVPATSTSSTPTEEHESDPQDKGRMGDQMVEMGLITQDQLHVALQQKKLTGEMLGAILVDLGFIVEKDLIVFLAETSGFGVFDPISTHYEADALALFDSTVAKKCGALPISINGQEYFFAMSDPYDVVALDTLRKHLPKGAQVRPLVTTPQILSDSIDSAYGYASSISAILQELEEGGVQKDIATLDEKDAFAHPIVRLVNALVFDAVKLGVSDLHFEPEESFIRLRYRLDGILFTAQTLHKQHWNAISQRLKIMSTMNIADKISAQDGRFNLNIAGREADFRVSSLPTVHGENIVLRVLDKSASIMPMEALGFSDENRERIRIAQSKPEGIIIVTGPTGSGKTTSLYSMLNEINDVQVNIQTLEDPVEYSLPMIRQTYVREGVLEFADGIKALLRQDPDIIFIGEIRDKTTAEMALKAAMTGHQVYTSLHTNDSFGAIPRLLDLGLKPGMLAGAVVAIFAQRLSRRLCEHCKKPHEPTEHELKYFKLKEGETLPQLYEANEQGCDRCAFGYKGRVALAEVLLLDDDLNAMIAADENIAVLRKEALRKGFKTMADDGILKVREGITDLKAVSKVVDITKIIGSA